MGFRFRRSARLGPLRFNYRYQAYGYSKGGLSSISVGGRGASFNIPVARRGGPITTARLPGTGLSWRVEHTPDGQPWSLQEERQARPTAGANGLVSTMLLSNRYLGWCNRS